MEWELSKENVQPMKSGRNVEVLNDALKAKAEGHARSNIFENQRRQMLDAIEHYSGDDPLQPWIRCIKWIKDAYPAGGAQSELLKVLEGCTRKFQKNELYRNDVRYLRVWVQYADCCTDPIDVFAFLEANDIGQTFALFYEAYATSMEVRRNYTKADEIFRIGISRQAQPLGRLENMYKSFLYRMVRRGERKMREEQQLVANGTTVDAENQVRAFGPTSHFSEQQYGRERGRQIPMQAPSSRSSRPKNSKISIFVDPEFEVSRSTGAQDLFGEDPGPSSHQSAVWCNLPGEADKKKENVQHPLKWTEAKITQNLPLPHVRHSGLGVYVDEEFSEASNIKSQPKPVKAAAAPILKLRLEDMQSLKRTSPRLKGSFLDFSSTVLDSARKSSESPELNTEVTAGQGAAPHPKTSVPSVLACDVHMINENGAEKCFEEVRLEVWKERHQGLLDPDDTTARLKDEECLEPLANVQDSEKTVQLEGQNASKTSSRTIDSPTPMVVETQKETTQSAGNSSSHDSAFVQSDENQIGRNGSLDYPVHASTNRSASPGTGSTTDREESPEGSLSSFKCSSDYPSSNSNSFSIHGDETIAIKRFADEIIVLGADPRLNGIDAGSHQGLVEPTINTKECLADILDMFNKPLESDKSRSRVRVPRDSKKRSSKSGSFQILVDEDLQTQRPSASSKDDKRVKASSSNFGGAGMSQVSGFQVYMDENVGDERPLHNNASVPDTGSSADISKKSKAEAGSFQIFQQENFAVESARPKQSQRRTEVSESPASRPKGFQILVDEEFCESMPPQSQILAGNLKPSPKKLVVPVSGKSTFKIYEDEEIELNSSKPKQTETRVKPASTRSSTSLGIVVDEEFRDLSLNVRLSDEQNFDKPSHKPVSPVDKENVAVISTKGASGRVNVSGPEGATNISLDGAQDDAVEHFPSERPISVNSTSLANAADSVPINPVVPVTVEGRPQTALALVKIDPWDEKTVKCLLSKIQTSLPNYEGFFEYNTKYSGPLPTSSVRASNGRTKIIELGNSTYRLKGCVGEGAFAHVFEAEDVDDDFFDDPPKIALKFQKPACPWEFYIYRQLDKRISKTDRRYYCYVRRMHLYKDCSFMICDYGEKGTLQDVVNAYLAVNQHMDEVLCMFYTVEMLRMLEVLHSAGIIHGDIKPDNFLIRDEDDSLELEDWGLEYPGLKSQGICLIDWGRSIDVTLFPDGTVFHGDCKTDSFRCPEMLERRPWTFQVDTFGLCGVVHCLLHGSYMQIEKVANAEGQTFYRPKAAFKRYWHVTLWKEFFHILLNVKDFGDRTLLTRLRQGFERHLVENNLGKKLKGLFSKQTIMMFTARRR